MSSPVRASVSRTATEVLDRRFVVVRTRPERQRADFLRDVRHGLGQKPKRLPCRWFYDAEGSRLFEEICGLREYYLTRVERSILLACAEKIAARMPSDGRAGLIAAGSPGALSAGSAGALSVVELGSGSAVKTRIVLDALLASRPALRYVPIDISMAALAESSWALLRDYETLEIRAVAGEYEDGLDVVRREIEEPRLVLWLGSNIGNLDGNGAARFLRWLRGLLGPADRVLCGIDLRKSKDVLERAYDDARGVTARFNKNLLARINRELGGHFDLDTFTHRAVYDEETGRVAMYLVSTRAQRVPIEALEGDVRFAAGETIHTEDSFKYSLPEIDRLAERAGLRTEARWTDAGRRFAVCLLARAR